MDLLTIGAFARASRLTPKALRLYGELGLVPPAAVDAETGYRFYAPAQLAQARLVAWLRRVGMPLAEIRQVVALPPAQASTAVAAYWSRVEADLATRGELAAFLVDHLAGRGTTMTDDLGIRYAARSDRGAVRETDEDVAYAGDDLLAVADGVGGVPGGAEAAASAVVALRGLTDAGLAGLAEAVRAADRAVAELGMTTLTALVRSGNRFGLVHVGDSRAYLLRNGDLFRLTQDHSYVQTLVDAGRVGAGEALTHPDRPKLVRALGAGPGRNEPDLSLRAALAGDRYLLCSDGLWAEVPAAEVASALPDGEPDEVVDRLIELAYAHGAPDNVAVVVADVVAV
ncbi:MerR family transcriptional regulator [Mangrovihabitans endophyticus]|uniref:Protein phosphatase n=1 Tax=Mangrovihabitans endophyticus TaxID=1751298 RepID=A0A8J3FML9_9ACTN|nr:MerR family transcriptional regulator [Mangrovihabitans endophyticus]GGK80449.1 hypothetical protein GCM10012284_12950 [Mangrovihabitans endophyticus]